MSWVETTPATPPRTFEIRSNNLRVSVDGRVNEDGKIWQYLSLSFGRHTSRPIEECLTNWPREAIRLVRAEMDELEAKLEEAK